jgi:hypothetical protein
MTSPTPVRDASRFLARLAEFTPAEWRAVLAAPAATPTRGAVAAGWAANASPELAAALRWLGLPGRREAHTVLHEWLDALATPLLAAAGAEGAWEAHDAGRALQMAEHAAVALLVSDALDPRAFDRLYAPFAALVPLASLRAPA